MSKYDIAQLSQMLANRAEDVCRWILPSGQRNGHEWACGSINGEAGDSLRVNLSAKAGVWRDFASDERGGDLVDLIAAAKGIGKAEAVREAKAFLGVKDDAPTFSPKPKAYKRPSRPHGLTAPVPSVLDFFQNRGITRPTLEKFKIGAITHEKKGDVIVFPYLRNGELVFVKYRPVTDKGGMWTSADSEPCLFGWQAMPENARSLTIVEGEIDALAFYEAGYCALSVPRGGGDGAKQDCWIDAEWERLQLFDTIFLALDNDEQGHKAAQHIAQRLGLHRCWRLDFGQHKDANEFLLAGGDFAALFASAATLDPPELRPASDYCEEVIDYFLNGDSLSGAVLPWPKTHDNIRLRSSEVSVWAGVNGHGKSQIVGHVLAHGIGQGNRWCVASMEFPPHKLLARLYRQTAATSQPSPEVCRGTIQDYFSGNLFLFDVQGTAKAKRILEVFGYAFRRYGCTHFLIDSLAKCGLGEDDYNGQKGFVDTLADFAMKNGLHVHLVCHSRKRETEDKPPDKMDVKGSGAITDMVDNVFVVWRNKPKERKRGEIRDHHKRMELETEPDCVLTCCKQRNGEWEGGVALWFDRASLQYIETPEAAPKPLWGAAV